MKRTKLPIDAEINLLQCDTFKYFVHETNPENGLVRDKTAENWPCSIAATGLALAAYPVAIKRGFTTREAAIQRVLTTLRFFWHSPQGTEPDATGYKGFYYHFLDMKSGRRTWDCELSTVDSTFLIAGMLTAALYFDANTAEENEIRQLADDLYRRMDWQWAQNGGKTVVMGWKPESGFLPYRWEGYDEAMLVYILGLGSPTFPLSEESYQAWCSTYVWEKYNEFEYLYAGSFFTHHLSHIWIDFRGIQDDYMREKNSDYFLNSRTASYVQREYAINNPMKFKGYGECCWGITASDGPGPDTLKIDGIQRIFYDYLARAVPFGPDDGTIAPWAVVASLPFAPEIVLPAIDHFIFSLKLREHFEYGFRSTFNQSHPEKSHHCGWVSPYHFGINIGPIILMIENYRDEFIWSLMRKSPYIVKGLKRAGFRGGWLPAVMPACF